MAKEKAPQQAAADSEIDFDLGITAEEFEQLNANQGIGFRRTMFGDYTFEITAAVGQISKGDKPHRMLKVTSRVVAAHDEDNKDEIGSEETTFYGGSPQSPQFMRERLKALCVATGVTPGKGGKLNSSMFIGKRYDASVVWEMSNSGKLDDFGKPKMYVNARLKGERKVGTERPAAINPAAESRKAQQHLEGGQPTDAAPWDNTAAGAGAIDTSVTDDTAASEEGFISEDQVDESGHTYRAAAKLGDTNARETLIGAGIDPDGPIDVEKITDEEVKAAYLEKFAPKKPEAPKKGGLPPLNGAGGRAKTGTRAPQART